MAVGLGRFGDWRLEKGGSFCWTVFWQSAKRGSGCVRSVATARARFVSGGFCATGG